MMRLCNSLIDPKFFVHLVVGGLTALIYALSIYLTGVILQLDYGVALSIALFIAVAFHFFASRKFTFKSNESDFIRESTRYISTLALNYMINLGIAYILIEQLNLPKYIGIALSLPITIIVGFFALNIWVFKRK